MYQKNLTPKTSILVNTSYEGETIEQKVNRIVNNKEPISDGAPLIYTDRKDGVSPAHNIKTDRFEIAVDAMDYVTKSELSKREARHKPKEEPKQENPGTGDSTNDTTSKA